MDFPIPMEDDKWRPEARVRGRSVDGRESDAELEVRVPAPTTVEDGVSVSRAVMERVFDGWRCTEGREPRPNCSHSIEKGSVRHMVVCAAGNLLFIQSHELRWRSKATESLPFLCLEIETSMYCIVKMIISHRENV